MALIASMFGLHTAKPANNKPLHGLVNIIMLTSSLSKQRPNIPYLLAKSHYLLKLADYSQFLLIGYYVLQTVTENRYCAPTK